MRRGIVGQVAALALRIEPDRSAVLAWILHSPLPSLGGSTAFELACDGYGERVLALLNDLLAHPAGRPLQLPGTPMLAEFHQAVQAVMAQDPDTQGRFSRAYVTAIFQGCLAPGAARCEPSEATRQAFRQWMQAQLQRHPGEAHDPRLTAARHAAHGFWVQWLAEDDHGEARRHAPQLLQGLLALTYPADDEAAAPPAMTHGDAIA